MEKSPESGQNLEDFVVTPEMANETKFSEDIVNEPSKFSAIVASKVRHSQQHKDKGAVYFRKESYSEALNQFSLARGFACVEQLNQLKDPQLEAQASDLFRKCSGNIAQCYMKLEKWESALEVIREILTYDLSDAKNFYRAGKCLQQLGKFKEAYDILDSGARIMRESYQQELSREFIELKNEVARELNQQQKELRELYKGALSPSKKEPIECAFPSIKQTSAATKEDPLLGIAAGVASVVALDKYRSDLSIDTPEILATGALLGCGLVGYSLSQGKTTKIASLSTLLAGIGFIGYKIWKSFV